MGQILIKHNDDAETESDQFEVQIEGMSLAGLCTALKLLDTYVLNAVAQTGEVAIRFRQKEEDFPDKGGVD